MRDRVSATGVGGAESGAADGEEAVFWDKWAGRGRMAGGEAVEEWAGRGGRHEGEPAAGYFDDEGEGEESGGEFIRTRLGMERGVGG